MVSATFSRQRVVKAISGTSRIWGLGQVGGGHATRVGQPVWRPITSMINTLVSLGAWQRCRGRLRAGWWPGIWQRRKPWGEIGAIEVVVDGLGRPITRGVALRLGILADFGGGVLGVVAPLVDKVADIALL